MFKRFTVTSLGIAVPFLLIGAVAGEGAPSEHVRAELVAETLSVTPGARTWLGLRLQHTAHWHSYWINPGDSGLATRLTWTLPDGVQAGAIEWPIPQRIVVGELHNFGYTDEVLLPVPVQIPANTTPGSTVRIGVLAKWLECEETCIPGRAELDLTLLVSATPGDNDPRWTALFERARRNQPNTASWNAVGEEHDDLISVRLNGAGLPQSANLDAFAMRGGVLGNQPPRVRSDAQRLILDFSKSDYFSSSPDELELLIVSSIGAKRKGWQIRVPMRAADSAVRPDSAPAASSPSTIPTPRSTP